MIRVALVAGSPAVRAGLGALLASQPDFVVLETAALPREVADVVEAIQADVVLLALEAGDPLPLPLVLAPDAAARAPAVVLLGDEAEGWAARALRAGARGALPRTATADQIAAAVSAAAAGLVVTTGTAAARVLRPAGPGDPVALPLTPREIEVLGMLTEGIGNKAIAARLGISEHTVKTHVGAVFAKLGVSNRAEAVAAAVRRGILLL